MTKNILFIDDSTLEYDLFMEAADMCEYHGRSHCITDPRMVFSYLQENKELPDLIMVDIRMPHVDGHELTRKIRKHPLYNHIYCVIFSSSDLALDREKAFSNGANYFFNKPDEFVDYPLLVKQMLAMANEYRQVA